MNPTMSSFIFLLSLALSFLICPDPTTAAVTPAQEISASLNELIAQACSSTPNKDLCHQTINADNKTPKNDINDLAFITFEAASIKTVANIEYITRSSEDPEIGQAGDAGKSSLKQVFDDCEQQYEGAMDDVDNSVNYLASRTKDDDKQIHGLLKDAVSSIEACQKNLEGKGPKTEQLIKLNQEALDLLNNALGVFHVIYKQK
ncbi:hypothetical protein ACET3Z_005760 [Daucus carota]